MRTGSRTYHIAALLIACLGAGVLYAGESAEPEDAKRFRFHSQAVPAAESEHALATLQFEIDSVDAALSGLAVKSCSRTPDVDRAVAEPLSESDDLPAEFWDQLEEHAYQRADFLEREERLLYGAASSATQESQPAEFHAGSPLRSLWDQSASGEHSGAPRSESSLWIAVGSVGSCERIVSREAAALSGVGRIMDVRAGLHLHAIRNGCLSKAANPHKSPLADLRFPVRSTLPALSFPFFFDSSSSSCSSFLRSLAAQSFRRDQRGTPRFVLIGVSV